MFERPAEVIYRSDVDAFLCDACDEEITTIAEASEEELSVTTEMQATPNE